VLDEIERIFDVDAEIANRALDLGVSEQDLNRSEIASGLVNDRHLRPPQRMRAVILAPKADGCYPLVHEPGKLPSADVFRSISSARKDIIIERATSAFQPVPEAGSGSVEQFELNWPVRLLLHDRRPCPHPATTDEFANPNFRDVAAAQLAIDGEVEQSTVTQPSFPFKPEPYRPYLLRLQRVFSPHHMAGVPRPTLPRRWVELRMSPLFPPCGRIGRPRCAPKESCLGHWRRS
jgi:hypothetical protein